MEKKVKEIKLKQPKDIDCSNCKFQCTANFPEELRQQICKGFWQLGDYRRQKDFILMNVKSSSPKRRRRAREPAENSKIRTNSKSFHLLNKRVCQSFFLKTLAISNGPLIKAFQHKNLYTNFFDGDDNRGKHTPSNKLGNDVVMSIVQHLEQFAANTKTKKKIITDQKIRSLRHLYNLYKETHGDLGPSYTSFKRIFNDNLFTFPPERLRSKAVLKSNDARCEIEELVLDENEIIPIEDVNIEEHISEETSPAFDEIESTSRPKLLVAQVPDSSKSFLENSPQVYEIQIIEISNL